MSIPDNLLDRLDERHQQLLREAGQIATQRGERAFLVGGPVRDLLLGRTPDDIDIVVEGEGMAVAQALARSCAGELTRHHAFQTAMVTTPDGVRVDVATARAESYPKPGQLPQVVAGNLGEDLQRRDFTINTMALALEEQAWGDLMDPLGGRQDLDAGRVRVMHSRSFADDPTRILRALRFALRFDYELEADTQKWLGEAVAGGYLQDVSADRVRKEIRLTLGEAPRAGAERLQAEGVLREIAAGLQVVPAHIDRLLDDLAAYQDSGADPADGELSAWLLVLTCLADGLASQARWQLVRRLGLSREERQPLLDAGTPWADAAGRLNEGVPPSVIAEALDPLGRGAILVGAAHPETDPAMRSAAGRFLADWGRVAAELDGNDLLELGVSEGPEVGEILARLRRERLDGNAGSADDERRLVRSWLAAEAHE